jgi:hypothetical protein
MRRFRRPRFFWEKGNGGNGNGSKSKPRRKVLFEPLEPRLLLSSDLSYAAAAGTALDATLLLKNVDGVDTLQIVDNRDQAVLQSQALADTSAVVVQGGDQADKLTVDLSTPFATAVIFDDASTADSDSLAVTGGDQTWKVTGRGSGQVGNITFSGVENLLGQPMAGHLCIWRGRQPQRQGRGRRRRLRQPVY